MKILAAAAFVVLAMEASPFSQTRTDAAPAIAGQLIVTFKPGVAAADRAAAHRLAGAIRLNQIPGTGVELVAVSAGMESASIPRYLRNPNVLFAEPNFIRSIPEPMSHGAVSEVVPVDTYFDEEYGLHNTGQMFQCFPWLDGELCYYIGTPDADIDAPEAWAISEGTDVRVAVIDAGIDYNHPDLAANYAGGYDFLNDDADPMDDHGHGTHVAGTIAAAISNLTGQPAKEEGVVGVAPHARVLAYKVCGANGSCSDFAIQQAIAQAITDQARVINMSLGEAAYSNSLNLAVQNAWSRGLVIVAAAGNAGSTALFYPAALDNVISVAAFDEDHRRASFSNYGKWVDISAPGNAIMSSYPLSACGGLGTVPGDTGCFTWMSGTSMASPHVAGAAALAWSRADVTTNSQVVDILLQSADPQGVDTVRLDSWTSHGGLNIHNALSYAVGNQPPQAHAGPDQTLQDSDDDGFESVILNGSGSIDPEGRTLSYVWREGETIVGSGPTPTVILAVGLHTLTLTVTDDGGATDTDTAVITIQVSGSAADTVLVLKATYTNRKKQLAVEATSSAAPDATLTVYDISNGVERVIGPLNYHTGRQRYMGSFPLTAAPLLIEVRSSDGGSDSSIVAAK